MAVPGPPVFDARDDGAAQDAGGEGRAPAGCSSRPTTARATFEELKGRGVEFSQEPTEQPYGIDAGFRDPSGNQFRMMSDADVSAMQV